jgi:hypothetical protein
MNSSSQTVTMAQTEHFTVGENPDGHAQGEKLYWLPLPDFLLRKKKSVSPVTTYTKEAYYPLYYYSS